MSSGAQTRKVRYAVVGVGHIVQVAVLPGFANADNSELVALVSGDPKKQKAVGQKYKVKTFIHTISMKNVWPKSMPSISAFPIIFIANFLCGQLTPA